MSGDGYANPDALVETDWVAARLDDPAVRLVESDEDIALYEAGHIPGAMTLDWRTDLQSQLIRDFVTRDEFKALMASRGIANDTTVVFYGDCSNRSAACSFWLFKLYGHDDCRIMNGGRVKWLAEGRPLARETPRFPTTAYMAREADLSIRAFRDQVLTHMHAGRPLVDVRSPEEYTGRVIQPDSYPREGAQRAGHIPTARNIPWDTAANGDGTFRPAATLREIYADQGITPDQPVITYCRIGERSAHTWFVLTQLLGYPNARNYDGSWTEWGSLVRAPIERELTPTSRQATD
jgi:thiosulfate/3-mercaptopyruvate sulfurtransferase